VLALLLPLFPVMILLSGRTLPASITAKLLRAHRRYTAATAMDFRIPPNEAIPVYMERWWWVPRNWALNVYLHIVRRSDDDRALHDHPWFSFSIVLDGGYFEHEIKEGGIHTRTWYGPGAMRFRWHGRKAHRLELKRHHPEDGWPPEMTTMRLADFNDIRTAGDGAFELPASTIFITGPVLRRWGFHAAEHGWIDAYDWDAFCEANGIAAMRMDGGSDAVASSRNNLQRN
jgi:hypothetical protein